MNASAAGRKRARRIAGAFAIAAFMALAAPPEPRAQSFDFPPTDFSIFTPDGRTQLGRSHYTVEATPEGAVLRGDNRYNDGQYDIEVDHLEQPVSGPPLLIEFRHSFFAADGKPTMSGYANMRSGLATCTGYTSGGSADTATDRLAFPDDTYAGASVLAPIQVFLRSGAAGALKLHVFSCTPTPRLIPIEVSVVPEPQTLPYPGNLVEVIVKPDFGWFNFIVSAFVPKLEAWFAPADQFGFVGGELARFYKGPDILMVKSGGHQGAAAQAAR